MALALGCRVGFVLLAAQQGTLTAADWAWTHIAKGDELVKPGDIVYVRVVSAAGGEGSSFASTAELTVNGRVEPQNGNWTSPLPPLRHNGYCIQTSGANNSFAAFSAF